MGNVNMPTPVALAGGALCLLAGYLVGAVAGSDSDSRTTAQVKSYDTRSAELCLTGKGVEDKPGAKDGELCGVWRRSPGDVTPREGDDFRFVSIVNESGKNSATNIYGAVVE